MEQNLLTKSSAAPLVKPEAVSETKLDWQAQKELQAKQRKRENDLKKCEEKISELEAKIAEIDEQMQQPEIATSVFKLQDLTKEQESLNAQLTELYEKWELLAE